MTDLDRLYENQERIDRKAKESWAKDRGYSSHAQWEEQRDLTVAKNNRKRRGR